ncbi:MAG: spore maturation protein [Clostridia bacterium]
MKFSIADLLIPLMILLLIAIGAKKRINVYGSFLMGAKQSIPLSVNLFPYIAAVFIAIDLMRASGLITLISTLLKPILVPLGVPTELLSLIVIKPFSGGGSLAVLNDIFAHYGADSFIGRCASIIMGSSETVFYISAIYFATSKVKNLFKPILIGLITTLISVVLSCLFCRLM